MACGRHVRTAQRRPARAVAGPLGQGPAPKRRDSRLPVCQDDRGWRRTERIRRQQEGSWQEAASLGGHGGSATQSPAVHSAKVPEQDELRLLLESARSGLSRLSHLWLDAGYEGRGKRWAEEWAKEGRKIDWQRLMPPRGYVALPRRCVVERTFSWLGQNRRMSLWTTRGCGPARRRSSTRR